MFKYKDVEIHWLGHDGFKIKTKELVIYIDPLQLEGEQEKGDVLLISHSHYDHLDLPSILNISSSKLKVYCSQDCVEPIEKATKVSQVFSIRPGEEHRLDSLVLKGTAAYNLSKPFHPQKNQWLGFILEIKGVRIYFAGDTDALPELEKIECDIALVPVSGIYVMTAAEAAELANKIKPKVVSIPMHWGTIVDDQNRLVGTLEDAKTFCKLCEGNSKILSPNIA